MALNKRIGDEYLNADFVDGQVLLHTTMNEIVSVTKTGINENYYDVQKIINGDLPPANALALAGATLSKASVETLQSDDNKVGTSQQVKAYVDNKIAEWAGKAFGYFDDALSSIKELTVTGTFYDCASISLTAGVWLVSSNLTAIRQDTTAETIFSRITDGVNTFSSGQAHHTGGVGLSSQIGLTAIVVVSTNKTVYLQGATSSGSSSSQVVPAIAGDTTEAATQITAIQVA